MKNLCIIPARGGSKRIPRKNLKDFCGQPIISYSILTAINSGLFDEVMVSTDDAELIQVAEKFGAKVPFVRSSKNSGDFATTAQVIEEVLENYHKQGEEIGFVCCLYATAPFVNAEKLKSGFHKLMEGDIDTVFPVVKFDYPVWRGLSMKASGEVEMIWKQHLNSRSQDLPSVYHDAGQWYWLKVEPFLKNKKLFTEKSFGIELSAMEVQDIDEISDWKLAEFKYEYLQSSK